MCLTHEPDQLKEIQVITLKTSCNIKQILCNVGEITGLNAQICHKVTIDKFRLSDRKLCRRSQGSLVKAQNERIPSKYNT